MCQLVIGFQHFDMGLPWIPMHVLSTYALIMSQQSTVKYGIDFSVRKSVFLELFKKKKKWYITQVRMFQESMENSIIIRSRTTCDKDQR